MNSNISMFYSKYDFKDSFDCFHSKKGLTRETVGEISKLKEEPEWMRQFSLRLYGILPTGCKPELVILNANNHSGS